MNKRRTTEPTIGQVSDLYQNSAEFRRLRPSTQRAYGIYLRRLTPIQTRIVGGVKRHEMMALWKHLGPNAQANTARCTSRMMEWAIENQFVTGPAPTVRLKKPAGNPYEQWTDRDIDAFAAAAAEYAKETGVTYVADAFTLGLSTGQRFSDIVNLVTEGWDGDFFTFIQQKTATRLSFRPNADFTALLEKASREGERYVLIMGPPYHGREHRLRYHFDAVRDASGVGKSFHGLRKTVAVKLREAGASDAQIAALLGHRTTRMVERYAQAADRVSLASAAANMLTVRPSLATT